jgi:ABC-type multidrug transport system ATPase subunit
MAIMGASGAGKTSLLDILARKTKRGEVEGDISVNGKQISNSKFKRLIGFVDQEDTLMGTLTVYETVLYSALLRLPRDMSLEAKKIRTLETMHELGILGIRDSRIGETGSRAISGGEKRRVSIACELVTSPSILFLDEPTSGLDSFNALSVVESLKNLARDFNRTVVFTIHQPRSNIVAMFDQLVLLARGKVVYSGEFEKCGKYFEEIGWECPKEYNIADYLSEFSIAFLVMFLTVFLQIVDLTMQESDLSPRDETQEQLLSAVAETVPLGSLPGEGDAREVGDEEAGTAAETESIRSTKSSRGKKFNLKLLVNGVSSTKGKSASIQVEDFSERLKSLINNYSNSQILKSIQESISDSVEAGNSGIEESEENALGKGYKRASLWTQFTILSGRAFKNMYRNPLLLIAHYGISILLASGSIFMK